MVSAASSRRSPDQNGLRTVQARSLPNSSGWGICFKALMGLLLFKYCCTVFVCWVLSPIFCRGCPHPWGCPANEPKTVSKKLQFIHSFGQWKGFPNHRHRRDQTLDNITKIYTLHAVNDSNHDEKPKLQWKLLFFAGAHCKYLRFVFTIDQLTVFHVGTLFLFPHWFLGSWFFQMCFLHTAGLGTGFGTGFGLRMGLGLGPWP